MLKRLKSRNKRLQKQIKIFRSHILNEKFVEDPAIPICIFCSNPYSNDRHVPISLVCGHIIGQQCLNKWLLEKDCCPICNEPVKERFNILDKEETISKLKYREPKKLENLRRLYF